MANSRTKNAGKIRAMISYKESVQKVFPDARLVKDLACGTGVYDDQYADAAQYTVAIIPSDKKKVISINYYYYSNNPEDSEIEFIGRWKTTAKEAWKTTWKDITEQMLGLLEM